MKNEQSRETGNIGYTIHQTKKDKIQKHNTIFVGHHYDQTHANNVYNTKNWRKL